MWASDPGAEPIIIEKPELKSFCFYCNEKMLRHGHIIECPICGNHYTEKITHQ